MTGLGTKITQEPNIDMTENIDIVQYLRKDIDTDLDQEVEIEQGVDTQLRSFWFLRLPVGTS